MHKAQLPDVPTWIYRFISHSRVSPWPYIYTLSNLGYGQDWIQLWISIDKNTLVLRHIPKLITCHDIIYTNFSKSLIGASLRRDLRLNRRTSRFITLTRAGRLNFSTLITSSLCLCRRFPVNIANMEISGVVRNSNSCIPFKPHYILNSTGGRVER